MANKKPRRNLKQELLGGTIEGPGPNGFIIRRCTALVVVNVSNKLQTVPKKRRPPKQGKYRRLFIMAFEEYRGNISRSCKLAGISRTTFYRWLESPRPVNVRFRQHLANTRPLEAKKDYFEECLEDIAGGKDGSAAATIFALKCLAADRGYREKPAALENASSTSDAENLLTEELQKLRRQIEQVAARFETDYKTELRDFLETYGTSLNPTIKAELASELEH